MMEVGVYTKVMHSSNMKCVINRVCDHTKRAGSVDVGKYASHLFIDNIK